METSEILKKVRRIEIKTRGLSNNIFAGQYHSAFKGRGMAFSEVREYQFGDDNRDIDWNVTARFKKPFVKVFEEERELTVMLMVDVSGSLEFGTVKQLKKDMVTEIAATLAFSAIQNNDKIGVIFFSDRIEKFIPPKKGRKHILYIIRELIDFIHPPFMMCPTYSSRRCVDPLFMSGFRIFNPHQTYCRQLGNSPVIYLNGNYIMNGG